MDNKNEEDEVFAEWEGKGLEQLAKVEEAFGKCRTVPVLWVLGGWSGTGRSLRAETRSVAGARDS